MNKEQARQFAFDWYDIIVSNIAKEKEAIDTLQQEIKEDETLIA